MSEKGTAMWALEQQQLITAEGRAQVIRMLVEIKHTLMLANECPGGPICDTIWMEGGLIERPETLFDYIDRMIEEYQHG